MSVPALSRATLPPGRSSVPQCRVHHFKCAAVILLVCSALCAVASSQPKDECQQNQVTFASQIHTIGSIDDALWAITKPDWNVYKLTPCPANDSLVHCMMVDSPVDVDTKWPKLAESFKSSDNAKAFNFVVDNSVVVDSSEFGHCVLAISFSQSQPKYFGFLFGINKILNATGRETDTIYKGSWISSDLKNKAYRFFESGKNVEKIVFQKEVDGPLMIRPDGSQKSICQTGSKDNLQVQFQDGGCNPATVLSVSKGVFYNKQFYLFASDLVYIFSDQAETGLTRMQTVALTDFFHCYTPSTLPHPTSPNATNHQFTANSTHMTTTAKGYTTTIIIVGVVVLLVAILALITTYYCWCHNKASNANINKGTSSPKDSKVNAKAGTVSKGSLKRSQTKVKTVAPKLSSGKQSQH